MDRVRFIFAALSGAAAVAAAVTFGSGLPAQAAASTGCEGGGFTITLPGGGRMLSGSNSWRIPAKELPPNGIAQVRGKYVEFDFDVSTFAVYNYTLTGAPNPLDGTGGVRTTLFASKVPDLSGRLVHDDLEVQLGAEAGEVNRAGKVALRLQMKDCTNGGVLSMEASQQMVVKNTLARGIFYFNNPGTGKVNFGNAGDLFGQDIPVAATKLQQGLTTSTWQVEAGGQLGVLLGNDPAERAPATRACTRQCQWQNRIQDRG